MEHYKRVAKYWRDSLVDKQFSKGKYQLSELEMAFVPKDRNTLFRINRKHILQDLLSFDDNTIEALYIPFTLNKLPSHNQYEKDYCPEILLPVIIKVQVSKNGFIYPISTPIIPRDLLLPLDKEDFFIGSIDNYDSFISKNNIPTFKFDETSQWEEFYSENIESDYEQGLITELLTQGLIDTKQAKHDFGKLIKTLSTNKTTKKAFATILSQYNYLWDQALEARLASDRIFLKTIKAYVTQWDEYMTYIDKLLNQVIKSQDQLSAYIKDDASYFAKAELNIASKITDVYEDLYTRKRALDITLFKNYATIQQEDEAPTINPTLFFSKRLGHNNNKYPLSDAQRAAVSALIAAKCGDILAVNGPPGTGKTTMLLSVVACLWIESALKGEEPPVIIANSTNNQAVTNIIDSFAKDFATGEGCFAGRWIDNIHSFGSYFVSSMREVAARDKGYLTEEALKETETEYFYQNVQSFYLEQAQIAFEDKDLTVEKAVKRLHSLLAKKSSILKRIETTYKEFHRLGQEINEFTNLDYTDTQLTNKLSTLLNTRKDEIEAIEHKWEHFLAEESITLSTLSFISAVKRKRNLKAKIFARENNFSNFLNIDHLDADTLLSDIQHVKSEILATIQKLNRFEEALNDYSVALKELDEDLTPNIDFDEIDKKADTTIRFEMFLIATHYWEGRWLLDMEQLIEKDHIKHIDLKYRNIRENNWKRRMKLTPCAVMTSFMLPGYFSFTRKINDSTYKSDYLYDFIDLLIVDEAGQVSPEVAGAGFAMAKKALVIGDTLQIPPINKLTKSIDIGNLHKINLISENLSIDEIDCAYKALQSTGITSNMGSVMKIAQNRSKYYPEKTLERGLYLYEHRRCYNNIIQYCNELCYKGVLKPMRGNTPDTSILPAMGYLHIDGKCKDAFGSKVNELEAKIIAGWIISNYANLRNAYEGKEIKEIVAVVTPFREQSFKIAEYLKQSKDRSLKDQLSQITVGTVHSLQGAEREVVLFSPTYSRHNTGSFIDSDKSMLNVAVSRAKDSFLVFGDMSIFKRQSTNPTGLLAKYLFENENCMLKYAHQYSAMFARTDLISTEFPLEVLTNHAQHDAFLKKALNNATQRIIIISPWLIYSTIADNGYDLLLSQKNIKITIYTDQRFNTYTQNKPDQKKEAMFQSTLTKLRELGVDVKLLTNIHSKIVIKDNDCLCIGSFNWFSAQREGTYTNTEHSIVYRGNSVCEEIENIIKHLPII